MGDVVLRIGFAIEGDALDVDVLRRGFRRKEAEGLSVLQGQHGFAERGACQGVIRRTGADGIEAEGGEDVPRRHLSGIVVARQAAGSVEVFGLQDVAHCPLGLPRLSGVVIHERHLVARLVAVPVTALAEHRVELGDVAFLPAHALHQPVRVVRDVPRVVAGGAFGDERGKAESVVFAEEGAVGMPSLRISGARVDDVAVVLRAAHQGVIIFGLAQLFCHLGKDEIIVSILQRARHLFAGVEGVGYAVL